jgi:poly(hydroxyalkanoate) granule-associated protein
MTDTVVVEEEKVINRFDNVVELAQKTLRAGIGAAVLVQEEAVTLFDKTQERVNKFVEKTQTEANGLLDKMIERGATVEVDGRTKINELIENRKKQVDETVTGAQDSLEGRIETVLHTMNVPTKSDIDSLNKKIATLTRKVNALAKKETA